MFPCRFQNSFNLFTVVLISAVYSLSYAGFPEFDYYLIDRIGRQMGQTSLVDVDRDGDLDWIAGCNGGTIWWFEYQGPDKWVRHTLGQKALTEVGGTALDIDGDGWMDQVSGGTWFRNTGKPRKQKFIRYPNGVIAKAHDIVAADIDGDGRLDILAMSDRHGLFWYKIPADPTKTWQKHKIGEAVHGGIDPRGAADIDGDGDIDVVRSNVWLENETGKGTKWVEHRNIDFGQPASRFPFMTKTWVVDLDEDGDNDIVQAEGDCASGRVAWHQNTDGKGRNWKRYLLAENTNQDFHSLAVADFDSDGDLDIFSGGGPFTKALPRRWFIWENTEGTAKKWKRHLVFSGKRCHEAKAADVDGDGDVDICSKPWNGNEHIYLRNMLKEKAGN